MPTDAPRGGGRGGHNNGGGGRGNFDGGRGNFDNGPKFRKQDHRSAHDPRHISPRAEQVVAVPPAVPGFGFQLPGFS